MSRLVKHTLAKLRDLSPVASLKRSEAFVVAEAQASALLSIGNVTTAPVSDEVMSLLPRINITRMTLPIETVHGVSNWHHCCWHIVLNDQHPSAVQRMALFHEVKHIIDFPFAGALYGRGRQADRNLMEEVCDHFAVSVLLPRNLVMKVWQRGVRDAHALAHHFEVPVETMRARLFALGLYVRRVGQKTQALQQERRTTANVTMSASMS